MEVEVGIRGSEVQRHPQLCNELEPWKHEATSQTNKRTNKQEQAREISWWLRALIAFAEYLDSVFCNSISREANTLFLLLWASDTYVEHMHTCRPNTQTHEMNKS